MPRKPKSLRDEGGLRSAGNWKEKEKRLNTRESPGGDPSGEARRGFAEKKSPSSKERDHLHLSGKERISIDALRAKGDRRYRDKRPFPLETYMKRGANIARRGRNGAKVFFRSRAKRGKSTEEKTV